MYKVICDNSIMCDSRIEELALINPVVNLEENKAGSFVFTIPPTHPKYDSIKKRKTLVKVYQDEELIFCGVCIEEKNDFFKQKTVYCEGELAYLNDSIQRPAKYKDKTVRGLLESYISIHNSQVEESKRFKVGMVTVKDSNDSIYCYTNMESTMQCLKKDLVDDLGGFFRIRYEDDGKYLDYLSDSQNTNTQIIKIGKNLLDLSTNIDSSDIATIIVPLGCKLEDSPIEGLEIRLTIESVNDGLDYVCSNDAIDTYGKISKKIEWDNVTVPSILKTKAEKYLSDVQFENMVIEARAVDLHLLDKDIEKFKLSDQIRVVSSPHGLDRYFRLTKMTINLNNPENSAITLGKNEILTLSEKTNQEKEEIKKAIESIVPPSTILKSAMENATQLIKNSMNGFITTVMNEDGTPKELLIMDTDSIETATKVWRWNVNGLGYSSTGYEGEYNLAITMDGSIVADRIATGTMFADRIKGGTLTLGGIDNANGVIQLLNESGNVVGRFNKDGIWAYNGYFEGDIKSKNAEITGGFINIQTSSKDYSAIELSYGTYKSKLTASGLIVGDNDRTVVSDNFIKLGGNNALTYTSLFDDGIFVTNSAHSIIIHPDELLLNSAKITVASGSEISCSGTATFSGISNFGLLSTATFEGKMVVNGDFTTDYSGSFSVNRKADFSSDLNVSGTFQTKGTTKLCDGTTDTLSFFGGSGSSKKTVSKITLTSSATASSNATKINEIIDALKAYNLV